MPKHETEKKASAQRKSKAEVGADKEAIKEPLPEKSQDEAGQAVPETDPGDDLADVAENVLETEGRTDGKAENNTTEAMPSAEKPESESEVEILKKKMAEKEMEAKAHYERLTYMAAEFDNFRRRTQKEKERLKDDTVVETMAAILPVLDNLERAVIAAVEKESTESTSIREGIGMVTRQLIEILGNMGVREIEALNGPFDPNLHHAVMHVEDEAYGPGVVVDVFQKGYSYRDETVIRHSMVKVAN